MVKITVTSTLQRLFRKRLFRSRLFLSKLYCVSGERLQLLLYWMEIRTVIDYSLTLFLCLNNNMHLKWRKQNGKEWTYRNFVCDRQIRIHLQRLVCLELLLQTQPILQLQDKAFNLLIKVCLQICAPIEHLQKVIWIWKQMITNNT